VNKKEIEETFMGRYTFEHTDDFKEDFCSRMACEWCKKPYINKVNILCSEEDPDIAGARGCICCRFLWHANRGPYCSMECILGRIYSCQSDFLEEITK
jgi:hypothetical protein